MFIENYAELPEAKKVRIRKIARKLVLDTLSYNPLASQRMKASFSRSRVQFLYFHHVFKDEYASLMILLKELSKEHTFISYGSAVSKIISGDIDKPYVAVSFDDGFKNNLGALQPLEDYGISACFFICPSIVGETDLAKISQFASKRLNFPPIEFMNWDDIALLQSKGHEIGGHTMTHVNLANTAINLLEDEIGHCFDAIVKRCGTCDHFAYPYGRLQDFTGQARKIVFSSGFDDCASAVRGCHIVDSNHTIKNDELLIRRDHIVLKWPMKHILYFLATNARKSAIANNYFPVYADNNIN
jgi:peptidoglycan/xylan/chitin deacetylase (PgdA/CDA1 family)